MVGEANGDPVRRRAVVRCRILIVLLYVCAAIAGVRGVYPHRPSDLDGLLPVTQMFIVILACLADGRARGRSIALALEDVMLLLWPFAVPAYLVWSRRWWGVAVLVLHAIGLSITGGIAKNAVGSAVYGAAWWRVVWGIG